jgi:AbiV family abortive infection protein
MATRPPVPGELLYENLFIRRDDTETIETLSQGLQAVHLNAARLIKDVELLVSAERYASASFLLATADEEIAKFYILADMCRLDFSRHQSILKRLCQAFYSHVAKHTYNQIIRLSNFRDMTHVKEIWGFKATRWWPSDDPESGEPDMPHETYFAREMPLYVDYIDYDQAWFVPEADTRQYIFTQSLGDSSLAQSQDASGRLDKTHKLGLCTPESLTALNQVFAKHYIGDKSSRKQIERLYEKLAQRIAEEMSVSPKAFWSSAICEWPLYHFTTMSF